MSGNITQAAKRLFGGWEETMITSCLEGAMGGIFADDDKTPTAVCARLGDFAFFAGQPQAGLLELAAKEGAGILVPKDVRWERMIEECLSGARRVRRFATKKDTAFDEERLIKMAQPPEGFRICDIDEELFARCAKEAWSADLVLQFSGYEQYAEHGMGVAAMHGDEIVCGASSYSFYSRGIEIEIDTKIEYRRRGLAQSCAAALILKCLERGLYPSWDAQNASSLALAEKLGYRFSHDYAAYELIRQG